MSNSCKESRSRTAAWGGRKGSGLGVWNVLLLGMSSQGMPLAPADDGVACEWRGMLDLGCVCHKG